jgi:hypothetical protein
MTPMSSRRGDMGAIAPPPIFHHLRKLGWSPPLLRSTTTQVAAVTCYRREAATAARSPSPTSPSGPSSTLLCGWPDPCRIWLDLRIVYRICLNLVVVGLGSSGLPAMVVLHGRKVLWGIFAGVILARPSEALCERSLVWFW